MRSKLVWHPSYFSDRVRVWKDAMDNFHCVITVCEKLRRESFACWASFTTTSSSEAIKRLPRIDSLAKNIESFFHGSLSTCRFHHVHVAKLRKPTEIIDSNSSCHSMSGYRYVQIRGNQSRSPLNATILTPARLVIDAVATMS